MKKVTINLAEFIKAENNPEVLIDLLKQVKIEIDLNETLIGNFLSTRQPWQIRNFYNRFSPEDRHKLLPVWLNQKSLDQTMLRSLLLNVMSPSEILKSLDKILGYNPVPSIWKKLFEVKPKLKKENDLFLRLYNFYNFISFKEWLIREKPALLAPLAVTSENKKLRNLAKFKITGKRKNPEINYWNRFHKGLYKTFAELFPDAKIKNNIVTLKTPRATGNKGFYDRIEICKFKCDRHAKNEATKKLFKVTFYYLKQNQDFPAYVRKGVNDCLKSSKIKDIDPSITINGSWFEVEQEKCMNLISFLQKNFLTILRLQHGEIKC